MAGFRKNQRIPSQIRHGRRFHFTERVVRRRDDDQLILMDEDNGEAVVLDWKRDYTEVDGVVRD